MTYKKTLLVPSMFTVSAEKNRTTKQQDRKNSLSALIIDASLSTYAALFSILGLGPSLRDCCHHLIFLCCYAPHLCFCSSLPFISPYTVFYKHEVKYCLSFPPSNVNEKITRSPVSPWQATAIPSSLLLMIINYMSLTNMPRAILSHLSCTIDFTFWIQSN